eukprot:CAMPEP_0204142280 /NCGR_PEP_ID=MMETSP0361-20130328/19904_1 /ASSEMBLY_ACC=CAM_ASM_000343 /TAXON_ID=268821 /ORGANISM="Scrippsiella Hangoei, Strain SHTV-5" /LENGTH=420 /DNA_ID=CAMNT_0051096101 /DNA_START=131 /DNA_END=1391 /DNA_ORIENTATION=+
MLPAEAIIHANYKLCFSVLLVGTAYFVSAGAAIAVLIGALFSVLATCGIGPFSLPRYCGPLDVFLGRSYRASTLTPDQTANNNVSLTSFGDKLVIAYRKADSHFASQNAKCVVATGSAEDLETWNIIWEHSTGEDDLREMLLFELSGKLFLYYARLEPNKNGFVARSMQWTCTSDLKTWKKPEDVGRVTEIAWDIKVQKDSSGQEVAYKASYIGNHYATNAVVTVLFEQSTDGFTWSPVGEKAEVYTGGISEVSFAFTAQGDLVAVGRNEDGDRTGFGSQLFFARAGDLGHWQHLPVSMPQRFDFPRMMRMAGDELLLFARYARQSFAMVPSWMPMELQRIGNILLYSCLPKGGAVYRIVPPDAKGWQIDMEGLPEDMPFTPYFNAGDTGFFSLTKPPGGAEDEWVIANYSSTCHSHAPW